MLLSDPYVRQAVIVRVIDGDTITVDLDLGFRVWFRETVRLAGIDAPEMRGANKTAGLAAKEFLESLLSAGRPVTIQSRKGNANDKYGRWLAQVLLMNGVDVSKQMIKAGHATEYDGGPRG